MYYQAHTYYRSNFRILPNIYDGPFFVNLVNSFICSKNTLRFLTESWQSLCIIRKINCLQLSSSLLQINFFLSTSEFDYTEVSFSCVHLFTHSNPTDLICYKKNWAKKLKQKTVWWNDGVKESTKKADGEKELAPKDTLLSFSLKYLPGYLQYVEVNYLQYIVSNKLD